MPNNVSAQYQRLVALIDVASTAKQADFERLIRLQQELVGKKWMTDDEIATGLGEDRYTAFIVGSGTAPDYDSMKPYINFGRITSFSPELDCEAGIRVVEKFINDAQVSREVCDRQISLLESALAERREKLSRVWESKQHPIREIERLAMSIHNPDLVRESRVYHLYNDGEFTNQKGGNIYGDRSEFSQHPPLPVPPMTFPVVRSDGISYAIVTETDGEMLREKMRELSK